MIIPFAYISSVKIREEKKFRVLNAYYKLPSWLCNNLNFCPSPILVDHLLNFLSWKKNLFA